MAFESKEVGDKLIEVGESQSKTGKRLVDAAAQLRASVDEERTVRMAMSLSAIERGTRSTRNLIRPIAEALHAIGDAVGRITVPSLDIDTRSIDLPVIGQVRVVTSVSVASGRPFRGIAGQLESVADDLDNVGNALKEIAEGSAVLHDDLPKSAKNVARTADEMERAGNDLIVGGTAMVEVGQILST